ncbi:TniQ family protein [Streptomyces sp. NPDC053720]|uniref:TniQ family protein n=1 Tax=Streptomyces sp. NPDC053720 TaxID=3154855 RepID=UPI00343B9327
MTELRTLSIRVTPLPGESIDSWLEALARRCWMPLPALLSALGLPSAEHTRQLVTGLSRQDLRQLERRLQLPARRLDQAVARADLFGRRAPRCRFCPQCLQETQGRWRLRWWLPWTFACTRHHALLHTTCPACEAPPRRTVPCKVHRHPPAYCLRRTARLPDICGTDLSALSPHILDHDHPLLDVQQQIDALPTTGRTDTGALFARLDHLLTPLTDSARPEDLQRISATTRHVWERALDEAVDPASQFGSWRLRERARTTLTHELLHREYVENEKPMRQIAKDLALPSRIVIRKAKDLGLTVHPGPRPHPFDDDWLREQYVVHLRSSEDIAREVGTDDGPVLRRLSQLGIPRRPVGVHGRRALIEKLDESLPHDIRTAVEATLHGWLRLRRFQIHMAFPSLTTSAAYIGVPPGALTSQFNQLEQSLDAPLFHRARRHSPQRPTGRGAALLRHLDEPHIRDLMQHALGSGSPPMPDREALEAAAVAFNGKNRALPRLPHNTDRPALVGVPQRLVPLLRHLLLADGPEHYAAQIATATGMATNTVYIQLKRLEAAGWLRSRREDPRERARGGRGRTYYTLTPAARHVPLDVVLDEPVELRKRPAPREGGMDTAVESDHEPAGHASAEGHG